MYVLSSRILLRPENYERSVHFYGNDLRLVVYREFPGGTVFFLGGGFLEISRTSSAPVSEKMQLWLQVEDVERTHQELRRSGVPIIDSPTRQSWGLIEMIVEDPDGVRIVIVEVPEEHPLRSDGRRP